MTISINRYKQEKHKNKVKRIIQEVWKDDKLANNEKFIGKQESVHCRGCSCSACKKSRKNPWLKGKNKITVQERKASYN